MTADLKYTAVAPWFGSNRMLAKHVAELLQGCKWVGVIFAGGMSEVLQIKARSILVNDKHRHVINLARTMQHPVLGPKLYRRLRRVPLHPEELQQAQDYCKVVDSPLLYEGNTPDLNAAFYYFICVWMGRNGKAGTKDEFKGGVSVRYDAGGGDSAVRFRNAVQSINAIRRLLRSCNFLTLDFRKFLDKCQDNPEHGLYSDAPFFGPGESYLHTFIEQDHRDLAQRLSAFKQTRIVVRYYDVPLIRELYSESAWEWRHLDGRDAANGRKPEVLLIKRAA